MNDDSNSYIRFDWAIKRILRDKANFEVLEGLMTVLIGQRISIMEILESESNQDSREDKYNRVDVKAKTADGEIIIVEVQLAKEANFIQRILFGASKAVIEQIGIGQGYEAIKKVYSINVLYFDLGDGDDYAYHGCTSFVGMNNPQSVLQFKNSKEVKFIKETTSAIVPPEEVLPEYFLLRVNQFNEVAKTPIEEWMAYLKSGIIKENTNTPGLQAAREKLNYMRMTKQERRAYEDYMVSVHAAKDAYQTAVADGRAKGLAEGFAEGLVEGRAEGIAEGRAEGIAEGRAKGIAEGRAKGIAEGRAEGIMGVAKKLKDSGIPVEIIMQSTGLTKEEIDKI